MSTMKKNYKLNHILIAYLLLISLFLQSCGNSFNHHTYQEKKQAHNTPRLNEEIDKNSLEGREFKTSEGDLVTFYEQDGKLQADVRVDEKQSTANYEGLPVLIEESTDLAIFVKLVPKMQQRCIHIQKSQNGKLERVVVFKGGLLGGMMEGDQEISPSIPGLDEIEELYEHFYRRYLEITPENCKDLVEFYQKYKPSFGSYQGGIFLKDWQKSNELANLKNLLKSIRNIKKFKVNCGMEDGTSFAKEAIRAMQLYKNLVELDLSGCQISDGIMEDIRASIVLPEKLRILNISNNNLSLELVATLRATFPNVQIISTSTNLEQRFIQPIEHLVIMAPEDKKEEKTEEKAREQQQILIRLERLEEELKERREQKDIKGIISKWNNGDGDRILNDLKKNPGAFQGYDLCIVGNLNKELFDLLIKYTPFKASLNSVRSIAITTSWGSSDIKEVDVVLEGFIKNIQGTNVNKIFLQGFNVSVRGAIDLAKNLQGTNVDEFNLERSQVDTEVKKFLRMECPQIIWKL